MEHGGSSNQQHNYTIRAPRSGVVIRDPTENTNTLVDANNLSNLPQQSFKHNTDLYMPLANVNRIMRRVLPPHAKIADAAKETMQECVSKFISFITGEANQRCHREYRKTISVEDIISAMGTLGFDDYMEPLTLFLNKYHSQDPNRNPMHQPTFARRNTGLFHQPETQLVRPPPTTTGHAPVLPGASIVGNNNYDGLPDMVIQKPTNTTTNIADANNLNSFPQQSFKRDANQYMPIANIIKIMHRVLPPNAKIADDAKETIQECVSEFISFITKDSDRNTMQHMQFKRSLSLVHQPKAQMARPPPTMGYKSSLTGAYTACGGNYVGLPQIGDYHMANQGVVIRDPTENTNTLVDANNLSNFPQQPFKRDTDQYMPLANVNRIMRRVLPPHAKIADAAKETMQECVSEFISFITGEANQRCHREYRKTISAEDIISAMGTLGFDDYMEPLTLFLNKYRSQDPNRNPMHQPTFARRNTGLFHQPETQLVRPPPPTAGHAPALPGGSIVGHNNYDGLPNMGNYYTGNQDGGEGSSDNFEFGPFSQFK
ncbi:hypothetical protein BUALT_Bualt03G0104000 [Buddleja alternifolia]|uniref:Transcription factor CBF/NF-Y/archaeal histone domain-containing protein n=1 Tax=Buddleja alternifolia TaxID=168488 RepID=A0AAV6Y3D9_9LAMI|nr:hypothetical protein BUALT_Bualt03G0104000 [Buddleja alternifolia]